MDLTGLVSVRLAFLVVIEPVHALAFILGVVFQSVDLSEGGRIVWATLSLV